MELIYLLPGASPVLNRIVGLHLDEFTILIAGAGIVVDGNFERLLGRRANSAHSTAIDRSRSTSCFQVGSESLFRFEDPALAETRLLLLIDVRHGK